MGDPTTEQLLPLIDAAAAGRAPSTSASTPAGTTRRRELVGHRRRWKPSATRFPRRHPRGPRPHPGRGHGPRHLAGARGRRRAQPDRRITARRGVLPPLRPPRRRERPLHLDLRHPAAGAHLDEMVDRLVDDWGVGYLKLDHNIDMGPGTDGRRVAGRGLLGHNRAYLDWLDAVLDRHPGLVLENCASGGMRIDYALLSRTPAAVHQRPAGPSATRPSPPRRPPPSPPNRPPSGPIRSLSHRRRDRVYHGQCDARPHSPVRPPRPDDPPAV